MREHPTHGVPTRKTREGKARQHEEARLRCYNCNKPSQFSMNYPKPRYMTSTVQIFMRKSVRKANKTLFKICQQYDNQEQEPVDDFNEEKSTSDKYEIATEPE